MKEEREIIRIYLFIHFFWILRVEIVNQLIIYFIVSALDIFIFTPQTDIFFKVITGNAN